MTERRQHRFFLTSQAVDLLYTNDYQHPSPREEARASGLAAFHPDRIASPENVTEILARVPYPDQGQFACIPQFW